MRGPVDAVIVGAGPYGLSLAAHLSAAGVTYRQFGMPMSLWRTAMPQGMYLKSQGFASNLADPDGMFTLAAFCAAAGRPYADYGLPVPLDTFVGYGRWFQSRAGLAVEESLVTDITRDGDRFQVTAGDCERVAARAVVVAVGVEHFAYVPEPLARLPSALCTHSSAHADLAPFRGRQVIVVGAGQSALESAALLHESGADVRVLVRERQLAWNGEPLPAGRPLPQRLREPEAGLGSGWATWFYSNHPDLYRHLPSRTRAYRARTALGPAGACWLRYRVEERFPVLTGQVVIAAKPEGNRVRLTVDAVDAVDAVDTVDTAGARGGRKELTADHVIAGTGYRPDVAALGFLDQGIRSGLRTLSRTAVVGRGYQSSVPGLYFVGPLVAPSFGPVMRFVYGARHAALAVTRALAAENGRSRAVPAMAARQ